MELETALTDGRGTVAMASERALSNEATGWIEARYHQPFLASAWSPRPQRYRWRHCVLVYALTQSPKRSAEQVAAHLGRPVADIRCSIPIWAADLVAKGLILARLFRRQPSPHNLNARYR